VIVRLHADLADGVSVYSVLEKGLEDLMAMCDVVEEKFKTSRDDFVNQMQE
jgi:DNA-directed RNA polymerase I and III subunit RPAC2